MMHLQAPELLELLFSKGINFPFSPHTIINLSFNLGIIISPWSLRILLDQFYLWFSYLLLGFVTFIGTILSTLLFWFYVSALDILILS